MYGYGLGFSLKMMPLLVFIAYTLSSSVVVVVVNGNLFSLVTDPFMPPWPTTTPLGPVYFPAVFSIPNGGGALGVTTHIGQSMGLNNLPMLPLQSQIPNAATILSVQDVVLEWTGQSVPTKAVGTITPNQRFVVIGTNSTQLLALQDKWWQATKPSGAPPTFTYKRELFSLSQRTQMESVIGTGWAPSDFCDLDNDGSKDELLIGGSTGRLIAVKLQWFNVADDNPTTMHYFTAPDGKVATYNSLAVLATESYSKPTCVQYSETQNYVAVGFKSGMVMVFAYTRATSLWTMLENVSLNPSKYAYTDPVLGTPVGNLYAQPAWVDLDSDNKMDGMIVTAKNGQSVLMFIAYSNQGGSGTCGTPPTCALGFFVLGCECKPCPAGTYRASQADQWCKACGGVDSYCEEAATYPRVRQTGECTYWAPYPSTSNPFDVSPNFVKDVSYYLDNYGSNGGAKVYVGGSEVNINTYWTSANMQREMFGGMKQWRNRAASCGFVKLPEPYYQGIEGADSTHGFIDAPPLVKPADGFIPFSISNPGQTPVNVTFSFGANGYFASVVSSTQGSQTSLSRIALMSGATQQFRLRIQTGSIPATALVNGKANLTVELITQPYWNQKVQDYESELLNSTFLTFQLSIQEATILIVPSEFNVEMQTNDVQTRMTQIFNLEEQPSVLSVSIEFMTNQTEWLTAKLEGLPGDNNIGSIAKCMMIGGGGPPNPPPECVAENQEIRDFSRVLEITFNSTNLMNGVYFANVFVNSMVIGCTLNVRGGPVVWSMSTIQFQSESGQPIPFGTDPKWRVDIMPSIQVTARDNLGNPTDNFNAATGGGGGNPTGQTNVQILVVWEFLNTTSPCPTAAGPECGGSMYAQANIGQLGVFLARFKINIQGTYRVTVYDPNMNPIGDLRFLTDSQTLANPMEFNVSAVHCNSDNALPNDIGSDCLCKPGFGVDSSAGVYSELQCTQCPAGQISMGGNLPCQPCPEGFYQDEIGQTECKRCTSYEEAPDLDKKRCVKCASTEFVRDTDEKWECKVCGLNQRVRVIRNANREPMNFTHPTLPGVTLNKFICACNANMYWSNVLGECITCPTGGFCVDRTEDDILPRYGYWGPIHEDAVSQNTPPNRRRRLQSTLPSNYSAPTFIRCRRPDACPGIDLSDAELGVDDAVFSALTAYSQLNANGTCTQCEEGFTGPLCFKCAGGYTRAGVDQCTKCLARETVVGLLILGAIFAIIVCIYIIRRTLANMETEGSSDEMILLRVLMSHLQSESMVQGIDLDWPAFVISMFDVFNLISSTGQSAFSLDCFVEEQPVSEASCTILTDNRLRTFFLSALFIALLPVFGFLCSSSYWLGRYVYIKRTTGKGRGRSFHQYNLVSIIIIVFLLYPSLVRTAFKFFSGSTETIAGIRFLEADFNIVFGSTEHLTWALCLGLPMILIYALGIPFGFLYILRTRRADTHRYGKVFTFLYTGFKPSRYYWEVIIMFRKLGIAACTIMLKPYGSDIQAFATSIIVFIAICLQLHVRPYIHDSMNFVECFGLGTLYMTLFLGLFQSSINIGFGEMSEVNITFGVMIVIINAVFLMFIFGKLFEVTYQAGKSHGWKHVVLMMATLGTAGTSKRDLNSASSKRLEHSESLVPAESKSSNPIFAKEASAVPLYSDVYDVSSADKPTDN